MITADQAELIRLANTKMHFGKHKGTYLVNLPENYVIWFHQKGFPKGQIGKDLHAIYEIKLNGLESLLRPLISKR